MKNCRYSISNQVNIHVSEIPGSSLFILILPAMGAPVKIYQHFCEGIHQSGLSVGIMNWRGEGAGTRKELLANGNFGYADLLNDLDTVLALIADQYPDKGIILAGHSLGGQLGALYTCHGNPRVMASVVIAGGNVGYQSWRGMDRIKVIFATQVFGFISLLLGWFPGKKIGFGGNQPKNIMMDWSRTARTGKYNLINQRIAYEEACPEVDSIFLGILMENDFLAPYAALKSLFDKFYASKTEIRIITSSAFHQITPDHFSWLREPRPVINTLLAWLQKIGGEA